MDITQEALKLLLSDIAQMDHDIEAIEENIRSLEARRDAFVFKRDLFRQELKKHGAYDKLTRKTNGRVGDQLTASGTATGSLHDAGMRDAIRSVLSSSKVSLQTGEIAQRMLDGGFQYDASTPLKTRLSNELSRMARTGHVRKTRRQGKLRFSLSEGG